MTEEFTIQLNDGDHTISLQDCLFSIYGTYPKFVEVGDDIKNKLKSLSVQYDSAHYDLQSAQKSLQQLADATGDQIMKLTDDVCFYQELLDHSEGYHNFVELSNSEFCMVLKYKRINCFPSFM